MKSKQKLKKGGHSYINLWQLFKINILRVAERVIYPRYRTNTP